MDLQQRLDTFLARSPRIADSAYVAPGATVIGDVRLAEHASVWPSAVLRGDINYIEVGEASNIQDGTVVHLSDDFPVHIGKYVTIGHLAMIHACSIGDECLVGMHATILDGAVIGPCSIIAAGALVTKNCHIPAGSMVMGTPAKVVKTLDAETQAGLRRWAEKYTRVAAAHKARDG